MWKIHPEKLKRGTEEGVAEITKNNTPSLRITCLIKRTPYSKLDTNITNLIVS